MKIERIWKNDGSDNFVERKKDNVHIRQKRGYREEPKKVTRRYLHQS